MKRTISFHLFIVVIIQLVISPCHAQSFSSNIPAAFNAMSATPQVLYLKKNHIKVPSGGHLQGIQQSPDSTFVITASSASYSYYLTAKNGQFTSAQKINESPFRHAGGCQMSGYILFVGAEDNVAKDKSEIMLVSHSTDGAHPIIYPIIHRNGSFKRSTAGAVGITLSSNYYLLAVADWDSRNIDFYRCTNGNPRNFDSLTTFHAPDGKDWGSYQSINLISDVGGKVYLIGFGLDGVNNRADLFEVTFPDGKVDLQLISSRNFKCKGASFRYGAGIGTTPDGRLVIYSCGRNVSDHTPVNIFK
ncbi:MAG: hypothetical protein JWO03_2308 [Bacteroidetes bacterium]|nr:hypothetical protein [Bacteroidota bacterium]